MKLGILSQDIHDFIQQVGFMNQLKTEVMIQK